MDHSDATIFGGINQIALTAPSSAFHQRLHQQGQWFVAAGDAHRLAALPRRTGCRLDPQEHLLDWLRQQEHLSCLGRWQEEESSDRHWAEWAAGHRSGSTPGVSFPLPSLVWFPLQTSAKHDMEGNGAKFSWIVAWNGLSLIWECHLFTSNAAFFFDKLVSV